MIIGKQPAEVRHGDYFIDTDSKMVYVAAYVDSERMTLFALYPNEIVRKFEPVPEAELLNTIRNSTGRLKYLGFRHNGARIEVLDYHEEFTAEELIESVANALKSNGSLKASSILATKIAAYVKAKEREEEEEIGDIEGECK